MAKAVDPSEILTNTKNSNAEQMLQNHPWTRCMARFFDYACFFLLLLLYRKVFHSSFPFIEFDYLVPFEFFLWIPFETLLLKFWGKTPGKFFFGIELRMPKKMDIACALRRSISVWFRGLGMGIAGINFFCLVYAYHRLKVFGWTSWDREDGIQVRYRPLGKSRFWILSLFAVFVILFYYSDKNTTLRGQRVHLQTVYQGSWMSEPPSYGRRI